MAHQSPFFVHQKLLLVMILALQYHIDDGPTKYVKLFQEDIQFCTECFQSQKKTCQQLFENLQPNDELEIWNLFGFLASGRRHTSVLKIKNSKEKIVAKYLSSDKQLRLSELRNLTKSSELNELDRKEVALLYLQQETRLDGIQFCSFASIQRFVEIFKNTTTYGESTIWLYLLLNIQPLLMPYLSARQFSVPLHLATCGFCIYQQYAGQTLNSFYGCQDFHLKLRIAELLLEAVLKFSEGFEEFRIYISDLNADNIVYDVKQDRLSIVDLDTVYIVDSRSISRQQEKSVHKHEYIECMNCFAYSPQDICQYPKSDINIFAACQLLREDLTRDPRGGFLQPIPAKYIELMEYLDKCVDCVGPECENRFEVAFALIKYIQKILIKM